MAPSAAQRIVIENCAIATVDADDTEYASGYLVVADNTIESIGAGRAPEGLTNVVRRIDGTGHLVTPGLVNTHHHFYQWITRGLATDHNLFNWLVALYPTWARIDEQMGRVAAQGSLAMMARGGVTTAMDHHYVYPQNAGDLSGAIIGAASEMGVRFTLARGSMDRSKKDGGLPPDFAVETLDGALSATAETVDRFHDASFGSMTQVAVAPCSPFSVSTELMKQGAELARSKGVRLHTHGSETVEEEQFCKELFGMGPTDYFESTGWLGQDVDGALRPHERLRHRRVRPHRHRRRALSVLQRTPRGRHRPRPRHAEGGCPGRSRCRRNRLQRVRRAPHRTAQRAPDQPPRRAPRGRPQRPPGAAARYVRRRPGARPRGRDRLLEAGKLADFVLWKLDTLAHASIADPVTALVFGAAAPVTASFVNGKQIVEDNRLLNVDEDAIARATRDEAQRLARIAAQG